jgi:NAD(P)-dependent dehydrogenase (short-subunit alcohol dehydrogenase family)
MYPEFINKIILVTGGTSGIGAACALAFAKEGAKVIIAARNPVKAKTTLKKIQERGGNAEFLKVDLSQRDQIKNLFDSISTKYGRLDYAVNNAGIEGQPFTKIIDYPEKIWDEVINLNLTAMWLCVKNELNLMLKQLSGTIINISSIAGLQASLTAGAAYTASKHGVVGLTKSAALEYVDKGIRVNAICPAIIHTELAEKVLGNQIHEAGKLHPIGRLGKPEEVADSVLWLSSNKASFITAIVLPMDGGLMG